MNYQRQEAKRKPGAQVLRFRRLRVVELVQELKPMSREEARQRLRERARRGRVAEMSYRDADMQDEAD